MPAKPLDLLTLGRVSMDLFSEQIGQPFETTGSFSTSVGGSPTNVAIGARRLGLATAVLTAVGEDKVADFVRNYLQREGVDSRFVLTKPQGRTGLAVVGVQPPATFPLTFYRENPADIYIGIADVLNMPLEQVRALLISGTALARGSCRDATLLAAERARQLGVTVFMDLDLRPDQWHDPRAYGVNVRAVLPQVDVVIGTEEESYAALLDNPNDAGSTLIQDVTEVQRAELEAQLRTKFAHKTWLLKRGARGVTVFNPEGEQDASSFRVEVVNTVGAGDAFASGLIYGYLQGQDWSRILQTANACGAMVVSRHGCAAAMPRLDEVNAFIAAQTV